MNQSLRGCLMNLVKQTVQEKMDQIRAMIWYLVITLSCIASYLKYYIWATIIIPPGSNQEWPSHQGGRWIFGRRRTSTTWIKLQEWSRMPQCSFFFCTTLSRTLYPSRNNYSITRFIARMNQSWRGLMDGGKKKGLQTMDQCTRLIWYAAVISSLCCSILSRMIYLRYYDCFTTRSKSRMSFSVMGRCLMDGGEKTGQEIMELTRLIRYAGRFLFCSLSLLYLKQYIGISESLLIRQPSFILNWNKCVSSTHIKLSAEHSTTCQL